MNNALFNQLVADAEPMLDDAGEYIPKTGIVESAATWLRISALIAYVDDVTLYRDTGKWSVYNVIVDGKAYVISSEITRNSWRRIKMTWDHRDACDNLTPSDLWEGAYIPVTVTEVVLNRAEGPSRLCGIDHKFPTLAEADSVLMAWAWGMPADQRGYDKVDFTVYLSNGDAYEGRFDLQVSHRKSASIKRHMVSHLEWVAKNGYMIGVKYAEQAKAALPVYRSL